MKKYMTIIIAVLCTAVILPYSAFAAPKGQLYKGDLEGDIAELIDDSDYGGMYMKDEMLHIKLFPDDIKTMKHIKKLAEYNGYKEFDAAAVIEFDAVYSLYDLKKAMDKLCCAEYDGLIDIAGVGINEAANGLLIDASEWTEEKKKLASEISGIDSDYLEFRENSGFVPGETALKEPPKLNGFTNNEYTDNLNNGQAEIRNMREAVISFNNKFITCDVFSYGNYLYVPLRNVAELTGCSVVYNSEDNTAVVSGIAPSVTSDAVRFYGKPVAAKFSNTPVAYNEKPIIPANKSENKNYAYGPYSFNCGGFIYVPLESLSDALGYYRYCDKDGSITIFKESGRLQKAVLDVTSDYRIFDPATGYIPPVVDQPLITEAEHIVWSLYSEPKTVNKCTATAISYKGKTYIDVYVTVLGTNFGFAGSESYADSYIFEVN